MLAGAPAWHAARDEERQSTSLHAAGQSMLAHAAAPTQEMASEQHLASQHQARSEYRTIGSFLVPPWPPPCPPSLPRGIAAAAATVAARNAERSQLQWQSQPP